MKFTTAATALALAGLSTAAESQQDYDTETEMLKESGLCRLYEGENPDYSRWQDLCAPTCGDMDQIVEDTGETYSISCYLFAQTTQPTFTDPQGETYQLAQCLCDDPLVDWAADSFVASLPAVGQVTCSVWKLAAEDAAKLLVGTAGAGAAGTASQTLIKVAKMLAKEGKSATEYEEYVRDHLEAGDSCDFDIGQMFEDAVNAPVEALGNVGTSGL
ncbi:hypothetical protein F4780DRAFT_696697 [Xylariomycetidae sp. FL0641]|nr:hypothetical protein F4780DRAFT_696697 [Xylariomycetidae sp. FL0641]